MTDTFKGLTAEDWAHRMWHLCLFLNEGDSGVFEIADKIIEELNPHFEEEENG